MSLTEKGETILNAMQQQYGAKKGEQVFYASKNAAAISGVDSSSVAGAQVPPTPFGGNSAYGSELLSPKGE